MALTVLVGDLGEDEDLEEGDDARAKMRSDYVCSSSIRRRG